MVLYLCDALAQDSQLKFAGLSWGSECVISCYAASIVVEYPCKTLSNRSKVVSASLTFNIWRVQ